MSNQDATEGDCPPTNCSAFTPGPWRLVQGLPPGERAIKADSEHWVCLLIDQQVDSADSSANGKLIAASPDLLNALQELLDFSTWGLSHVEKERVETQAREAIAKALGQNSSIEPTKGSDNL